MFHQDAVLEQPGHRAPEPEVFTFDVRTANGRYWRAQVDFALVEAVADRPLDGIEEVEHAALHHFAALQFAALRAIARAEPGTGIVTLTRHDLRI
jgi:hypothetical protein